MRVRMVRQNHIMQRSKSRPHTVSASVTLRKLTFCGVCRGDHTDHFLAEFPGGNQSSAETKLLDIDTAATYIDHMSQIFGSKGYFNGSCC